MFSSLFSTKVNSRFFDPTDEPFKSPSPFINNFGALLVGISYLFEVASHCSHRFSIDILRNNLEH